MKNAFKVQSIISKPEFDAENLFEKLLLFARKACYSDAVLGGSSSVG